LPALPGRESCLLGRIAPLRLRQIPHPQRDRYLGAAELHLDAVVGPALEAELAGPCAEVVLRVRAFGPFRGGLALEEAIEDVVVVDVEAVADLAPAEPGSPECHRLPAQVLEVGVLAVRVCH